MSEDSQSQIPTPSGLASFWRELKRRKVMRVAITYAVVAWLIIQIASATFVGFGIPVWAFRFVVLMLALGFPVALIITWAFELTPEGIKTTKHVRDEQGDASLSKKQERKRNWYSLLFAAAVPTLIFGSLAVYFFANRADTEDGPDKSIAVLPLVNMSPDEDNIYFANGVHEDILTDLSRIDGFQVISRTSMLRYATSNLTVPEIGRELSARYIVEGSVRRFENHVRVTIQLIDARNDHHLWASNFERELVNVFETQSDLARDISNSIQLQIAPETIQRLQGRLTANALAYDLYQKAVSIEKSEGETQDSTVRRRKLLEQAVKEDPNFVEVWGQLKRMYDLMLKRIRQNEWTYGSKDAEALKSDLISRSTRALTKAITLDPDNVESLLASVVNHVEPQPPDVLEERKKVYERILSEHPDHAMSLINYGWWHTHIEPKDFEGAKIYFERALKADPFNVTVLEQVMDFYRWFGNDPTRMPALEERLEQIVPETAEDRFQAKISIFTRFRQLYFSYLETGDPALRAEWLKLGSATTRSSFAEDSQYKMVKSSILIESGDLEGLIEFVEQNADADLSYDEATPYRFWSSGFSNLIRMWAMQYMGQETDAKEKAMWLLDNLDLDELAIAGMTEKQQLRIVAWLAQAHAILGQTEEARRCAMQVEEGAEEDDYSVRLEAVFAWTHIDPDHAMELFEAIDELYRERYLGLIATTYFARYPLLEHPKMQAAVVKDGRWLDYLAERMPAYAKYKKLHE